MAQDPDSGKHAVLAVWRTLGAFLELAQHLGWQFYVVGEIPGGTRFQTSSPGAGLLVDVEDLDEDDEAADDWEPPYEWQDRGEP